MIVTAAAGYGYRARIVIDTEGATPGSLGGTLTLWRHTQDPAVPAETVAGARGVPATSMVVVDVAATLGVPVRYEVVTGSGLAVLSDWITIAGPATPVGPACLVTHPVSGNTATVAIVDWQTLDRATQGEEMIIPGRAEALLISDVEMMPNSRPRLLTFTRADERALDDLLAPGEVVLIRTPCPGYPDTWVASRARTTARISRQGPGRIHEITATHHLHPSPGVRATGDTLGNLHALVPGTLRDITVRWPGTLLDIAATDMKGELNA